MSATLEEERPRGRLIRADAREASVSPLELFFDLVFVFALTQVTAFLADDPTFSQLGRGLLMLAIIWWSWSGYTWLTSTVDPELTLPRLVMFAGMGAMLILALATPGAFADDGVVWGVAYLVLRLLHAALFALAARGDPALARVVVSLLVSLVPGAGLIIFAGAALEPGTARDLCWAAAVVLDYGIVIAAGTSGWHVHARHFAERFGLIVIIALGESIVAIGVGAREVEIDARGGAGGAAERRHRVRAVVGVLRRRRAGRRAPLRQRRARRAGADRARLLRAAAPADGGRDRAVRARREEGARAHRRPAEGHARLRAVRGLALYLLAHVVFRLRNVGSVNWPRVVTAAVCLALIPLATEIAGSSCSACCSCCSWR